MRFCPGCGKSMDKPGVCLECRPKEYLIKEIKIKVCSSCRNFFYCNKWIPYKTINEAIIYVVGKSIKSEHNLKIEPMLDAPIKPGIKKEFEVELSNEVSFTVPAKLEVTYCPRCSKKQGGYYEGILQVKNPTTELLKFIRNYLEDNNVFISKEKISRSRAEFHLSDKKKLRSLGKSLLKFGGSIKESPTVHTKDRLTSKDVHRLTVLYEAPEFFKGDVIKQDGRIVLVTHVDKSIHGIDVNTGKKHSIKPKEYRILPQIEAKVVKTSPKIEILDPETYQSVPVENPRELKTESVKVVKDSGLFYLVEPL